MVFLPTNATLRPLNTCIPFQQLCEKKDNDFLHNILGLMSTSWLVIFTDQRVALHSSKMLTLKDKMENRQEKKLQNVLPCNKEAASD